MEKQLTRNDIFYAPVSQYDKPPIPPKYPPLLTVYAVVLVAISIVVFVAGAMEHHAIEKVQQNIHKALEK